MSGKVSNRKRRFQMTNPVRDTSKRGLHATNRSERTVTRVRHTDYCVLRSVRYHYVKVARLLAYLGVVQVISETCKRRDLHRWLTEFSKWPYSRQDATHRNTILVGAHQRQRIVAYLVHFSLNVERNSR